MPYTNEYTSGQNNLISRHWSFLSRCLAHFSWHSMQILTGLGLKSVRHGKERHICVVDTLHMPSPIHAKLAAATERTWKVLSPECFVNGPLIFLAFYCSFLTVSDRKTPNICWSRQLPPGSSSSRTVWMKIPFLTSSPDPCSSSSWRQVRLVWCDNSSGI